MLLMRTASIFWASGRGLGPGNREYFGSCETARADSRVPFGAQKNRDFQGNVSILTNGLSSEYLINTKACYAHV
jgi:hypothetical protein